MSSKLRRTATQLQTTPLSTVNQQLQTNTHSSPIEATIKSPFSPHQTHHQIAASALPFFLFSSLCLFLQVTSSSKLSLQHHPLPANNNINNSWTNQRAQSSNRSGKITSSTSLHQ
ncbi:hypothetical protein KY290_031551 [Solanum tuberosum]|uniref:Uncharacterized protein n=1 Tax=Solanum tuberosum TaxID=4113 RepID=A0ABQ7UAM7_SOLTU|nr:hypothetical protein KY284_030605 [Solanum tuberosum]KAH0655906.1 hypothetical protein KY285_030788 [Solanum tuberosum]KAH0743558.1 hypothetical protein KY290_031551 [Solanum tuberosum]